MTDQKPKAVSTSNVEVTPEATVTGNAFVTEGKPVLSEGVRQDLLQYGEATDPNTGKRITRDEFLDADGNVK